MIEVIDAENKNSYKQSLKATSLFGGVQVFNILIQIIRSKFAAVLLGPEGMGLMGLLNSTITMISSFTNCGLGKSAVRNIAEANGTNDIRRISLIISVFRRLVWITGLLGASVCLISASYLSQMTFGNTDYTFAFIILSVSILLMQLTSGQNALMQGMRKYRYLAMANVVGNGIGLAFIIPLYYLWGINAIVPVLLISNVLVFILAFVFARKIKVGKVGITVTDLKVEGKDMLKMGILISLQGMLAILASYVIRIFISRIGSIDEVGLYNAGFTIVNTYVGLIFTAMATDYYPRLSAIASDNKAFVKTINQQAEISLLLLAPIIIAFIAYIRVAVVVLYSTKFIPVEGMMYWAMAAMFFKAMAWSMSYGLLAKGASKLFFWNEFVTVCYGLIFNMVGYYYWGLIGLGISSFIKYGLYFLQLWIICQRKCELKFSKSILKLFVLFSCITGVVLVCKILMSGWSGYAVVTMFLLLTGYYSYVGLDRRIGIKQAITNKLRRKN